MGDFLAESIADAIAMATYVGSSELNLEERREFREYADYQVERGTEWIDSTVTALLDDYQGDPLYHRYRRKTRVTAEVCCLAVPAAALLKSAIGFSGRALRASVRATRVSRSALGGFVSSPRLLIQSSGCSSYEGRIWTSTKKRSAVQNALYHSKKHRQEFVDIVNSKQYVERAHGLYRDSGSHILRKTRPNGEQLIYDTRSNTFGAYESDGTPKTLFRPKEGISYWNTRD